jgi:predicted amidohydrolase
MRIALYQGPPGPNLPAQNLLRLEHWATEAARRGAELVVFPEMFISGYNIGAQAAARHAQPPDGAIPRQIAAMAKAKGIAIAYGYPEAGDGGAVHNAAQLVSAQGVRLLDYRKVHLFGDLDKAMFQPGDGGFCVAELNGWKLGLLICYDVEFPEAVRQLALAGAQLVLVPTANMVGFETVAHITVRARAYENGCYLAYANYCGNEGALAYCGLSSVSGPEGALLAIADDQEGLLVVNLDAEHLLATRAATPYLLDRRAELYRQP